MKSINLCIDCKRIKLQYKFNKYNFLVNFESDYITVKFHKIRILF